MGTVTPPKEISPLRTTNSFAIFFFFHFPKENFRKFFFYVLFYTINSVEFLFDPPINAKKSK
jgi:hypothetical protein